MKYNISTLFFLVLIIILTSSAPVAADDCNPSKIPLTGRANWIIGNWGVRFVIPGGNSDDVKQFDIPKIINQLNALQTPKWIMLNLTMPSWGGYYSGPHPDLTRLVHQKMAPERDLFGEMAKALKLEGFRIIVYFASQGPLFTSFLPTDKHTRIKTHKPAFFKTTQEIEQNWQNYLSTQESDHNHEMANLIIKYFSKKYGRLIDGWWFDHGHHADNSLYTSAARSGNPDAAVAWNAKHTISIFTDTITNENKQVWMLSKSYPEMDFTDGHVTPAARELPWWDGNGLVIEQIERCANIDGAVPHFFLPLQSTWRAGKFLFPMEKSIQWTERILKAGGGITWAVAMEVPEFKSSQLAPAQYSMLLKLDEKILASSPELKREKTSPFIQ